MLLIGDVNNLPSTFACLTGRIPSCTRSAIRQVSWFFGNKCAVPASHRAQGAL